MCEGPRLAGHADPRPGWTPISSGCGRCTGAGVGSTRSKPSWRPLWSAMASRSWNRPAGIACSARRTCRSARSVLPASIVSGRWPCSAARCPDPPSGGWTCWPPRPSSGGSGGCGWVVSWTTARTGVSEPLSGPRPATRWARRAGPWELAHAHHQLGRHLAAGERSQVDLDQTEHLERARSIFEALGCRTDLLAPTGTDGRPT
jgi:hypothetical protein